MNISQETPQQTEKRILELLPQSDLKIYSGSYAFEDFGKEVPIDVNSHTLALVLDDHSWSRLIPSDDPEKELYGVFRFHFPEGVDNSGFVGWLSTHIKQKFGSGVMVVCGFNSSKGGIYDYYGCPFELAGEILPYVESLCK